MKKILLFLSVAGMLSFGAVNVYAQDEEVVEAPQAEEVIEVPVAGATNPEVDLDGEPLHQVIKQKLLEGGVGWMTPVLLCLIFGLAIVIERVIYLNLATTNTRKLIANVEDALANGGIEAAKEVCRNTRGPVASIFYQGLERYDEGLDVVEKSVVSYGSVQMGQMESGLTWISLFIAIAPMLGFMGTVVGMIGAFDSIQAAGDISPTLVAGGIKVALLTTLAGLIVAVILQIFYNYILSKVDSLVVAMEDSSITLVDILTKYSKK
ncbi:MAG: MotA/TolQ/ExbB proton channel family protein [Alistipes sp.]|nr:MotA/TolQ/ExbB proton channel family protein [Alistipes sp.]